MTVFSTMAQSASASCLLAQATGGAQGGGMNPANLNMIMLLVVGTMFFVMFRSQRQKQKEADDLQKAIQPGDDIVTIGGAHGTVTTVKEKTLVVRVAEGKIEYDRTAIAKRISKADAGLKKE
jgi:preprotein translocase subunit YajC